MAFTGICHGCGIASQDLQPDNLCPACHQAEKQRPATIDITPTWTGLLPALIAALQDGTPEGQRIAREELAKCAAAADAYIAKLKEEAGT